MNLQHVFILTLTAMAITSCNHKPAVVEESTNSNPTAPQPSEALPSPTYAWGYEGEKASENWASLNPSNSLCATGKKQSPINLAWRKPNKKSPRMDFSYTPANVVADISTPVPALKFNGANQLLLNGKVFNLERIEFHSPSEHQLSKNTMSMEIQFIHKAVSGNGMAALAVFAIEGRENSLLNDVWNQFVNPTAAGMNFDAALLIPPQKTHYHYQGSLTSPPCTENVEWIVFNTPTEVSKEQILAFRSKFAANSRPVQPLNARKISNF
jgi:carbonic anhydrase